MLKNSKNVPVVEEKTLEEKVDSKEKPEELTEEAKAKQFMEFIAKQDERIASLEGLVTGLANQQAEVVGLLKQLGGGAGGGEGGGGIASLIPLAKMFMGGESSSLDQSLMDAMKKRMIENLTADPVTQAAAQFKSLMNATWRGLQMGRSGRMSKKDFDKIGDGIG